MTDDEDIETEDAKGLGARMVEFEKSMRDVAAEATFSDNIGLANEIQQRLRDDGRLRAPPPDVNESLTDRLQRIEDQLEVLMETVEMKLNHILERIG